MSDAVKGWSFNFTGIALQVKEEFETWAKTEEAKLQAEATPAIAAAKSIVAAFISSVDQAATVAVSAADSDLAGAGFNVKLVTVDHPPMTPAPAPEPSLLTPVTGATT